MRLPRDSLRRRRLGALAAGALLAATAGVVFGSGSGDPGERPNAAAPHERAPAGVAALPLERQVGELLVMAFDGVRAPAYVRRRLRHGEGAGVILFGPNVTGPAALRGLTQRLQRAAGGDALVMTDQEGGEIRNVPWAGPATPQSAVATPAAAATAAAEAARGLADAGINVNLAPVADVAPPSGGRALAGRLYPGPAVAVAQLTVAAVRAHARAGVAATVKHYPGLGRAAVNTDDGSTAIASSLAELEAADLVPFGAAIDAGVPLVMAGHALYPEVDASHIASQSRVLLGDVLRDRLGFEGVVITDSIEAQAVLDRSGVATAAVRAVAAGADLVLMTGSGSWNLVYPRLLRRARRDPAFGVRVRESTGRVLALKRRLGLARPGL